MSPPLQHSERQTPYLFFHKKKFYVLRMKDDEDAIATAEFNDAAIRVEDMEGHLVWVRE